MKGSENGSEEKARADRPRGSAFFLWRIAGPYAVLVAAGVTFIAPGADPAGAGCEGPLILDFAGLQHGTILGEQYAASGIHISAIANEGRPNNLIAFNSNASGTKDPDLEAGIGNLAIIPENIDDADGDGLVDRPSPSMRGGKQIYTFASERTIGAFTIVDSAHGNPRSHFAAAFDARDNLIKEVPVPILSNGSVQTIAVNARGIRRLEIVYRDDAGVTDIEIDCPGSTRIPPPDPTPTPVARAVGPPASEPTSASAVLPIALPPTGGDPHGSVDSWPAIAGVNAH